MRAIICPPNGVPVPEDLVIRLRTRAEIRRKIPRGEPDRISDILEEAAGVIERLRESNLDLLSRLKDALDD